MKRSRLLGAVCPCLFTLITASANAALLGRDLDGNLSTAEAYYDDVADLTWLADANAGAGSIYDEGVSSVDGKMTWDNANAWAADLDVGGVTGWRLPTTDPALPGYSQSGSEMGNMFYNVLGGVAYSPITITHNSNYDLFSNVQSFDYWSSTEFALFTSAAWYFAFGAGGQFINGKDLYNNAWAVQSGDVATIPIPPALWLFGSGLLGLVGIARNRTT